MIQALEDITRACLKNSGSDSFYAFLAISKKHGSLPDWHLDNKQCEIEEIPCIYNEQSYLFTLKGPTTMYSTANSFWDEMDKSNSLSALFRAKTIDFEQFGDIENEINSHIMRPEAGQGSIHYNGIERPATHSSPAGSLRILYLVRSYSKIMQSVI